eukprot:13200545-Ditylum_brightwellii.AAC.1
MKGVIDFVIEFFLILLSRLWTGTTRELSTTSSDDVLFFSASMNIEEDSFFFVGVVSPCSLVVRHWIMFHQAEYVKVSQVQVLWRGGKEVVQWTHNGYLDESVQYGDICVRACYSRVWLLVVWGVQGASVQSYR